MVGDLITRITTETISLVFFCLKNEQACLDILYTRSDWLMITLAGKRWQTLSGRRGETVGGREDLTCGIVDYPQIRAQGSRKARSGLGTWSGEGGGEGLTITLFVLFARGEKKKCTSYSESKMLSWLCVGLTDPRVYVHRTHKNDHARYVKHPVSPSQSSVDYESNKRPSMH